MVGRQSAMSWHRLTHWCMVLVGAIAGLAALAVAGCNSPYPKEDEHANILYTTFGEEPKNFDPATAYSSDSLSILANILEPPLEYNLLKQPYELEPQTCTEVPVAATRAMKWQGETVEAVVYTVRLKPGILYQDHPCFVEANRRLTEETIGDVQAVTDFPEVATRALQAEDYVLGIRRLADPRVMCPILSTLEQNVLGLTEYAEALSADLDEKRAERAAAAGPMYNREQDEKYNPIDLDYAAYEFPGVRLVDDLTFEIVLSHPYPQILYWMAMPFFSPVPAEVVEFFQQPTVLQRSMIFDKSPMGTGPFMLDEFDPTNEIALTRNTNYRSEVYPAWERPGPEDVEGAAHYDELLAAGMLEDAGRELPMVDRVVYRREPEWIPRWTKFCQGYYDASGIDSDVFDQSITLTSTGDALLSPEMQEQGITLYTAPSASVSYFAFNMTDPVVGGYDEEHRKLRQAISIAFETEEQIAIFSNGRGTVAHSPIPPGLFGYEVGEAGMSRVSHIWNAQRQVAERRSIEDARQLLSEAGYEDGYGADGKPLVLYFDNSWTNSSSRSNMRFVVKQFAKLGIQLESRTTDYNRFQDKVREGSYQILSWGWLADYPDPENFLFLLYGPNGQAEGGGENHARYASPAFDELFERMCSMEDGPERMGIIRQMNAVLQEDVPWFGCAHGVSYSLVHQWFHNGFPNAMAGHQLKYRRIDVERRAELRREWNGPRWYPPVIFIAILILTAVPAIRVALRHLKEA